MSETSKAHAAPSIRNTPLVGPKWWREWTDYPHNGLSVAETRELSAYTVRLEDDRRELLKALKSIQPEMRREHDARDGHFSTAQVEVAEAAIAKAEGRA